MKDTRDFTVEELVEIFDRAARLAEERKDTHGPLWIWAYQDLAKAAWSLYTAQRELEFDVKEDLERRQE